MTKTISSLIQKLDIWSDETIKSSLVFNFIKNPKAKISKNDRLAKLFENITNIIFLGILICLNLPQFASDRFGIGIMIGVAFIFFLGYLITKPNLTLRFSFIDIVILVFLLFNAISTLSSYFFIESISGLLKIVLYVSLYSMIRVLSSNSDRNFYSKFWSIGIFLAFVVALYGIYQNYIGVEPLATWDDPESETMHTRVYSTMGNPNLLAGYLLLIFPISVFISQIKSSSIFIKIVGIIISITIFTCILMTGSRGAYIGLILQLIIGFIGILVFLYQKNKISKKVVLATFIFGIIASSIVIYLFFPIFYERLETILLSREHSSNNFRMNVWLASLNMLKDNFILGIGPGSHTFRLVYGIYMFSGYDALSSYNIFLEMGVELGILGLLFFILIFISSFAKLHCLFWQNENILSLGFALALLGMICQGMVDTVFFRSQIFILFWFLTANIATIELSDKKLKDR